jgi:uncharacterized protein DUF1707/2TM domain-containing protein
MAGELTRFFGRTQVRASDEERERAVSALRHNYAAGRITSSELEERVERAYDATTLGDIDRVLYDLPSDRGRRAATRLRAANRGAWRAHLASYASVNGGLVAIWGATGGGEFWPGWPLAWWGMFLGWHWLAARAVARRLRRQQPRQLRSRRPSRPLPR